MVHLRFIGMEDLTEKLNMALCCTTTWISSKHGYHNVKIILEWPATGKTIISFIYAVETYGKIFRLRIRAGQYPLLKFILSRGTP